MTGFLIKKNLYDGWDNLFKVILLNLGAFLILCGTFSLVNLGFDLGKTATLQATVGGGLLYYGSFAVGIILMSIYVLAISVGMANIAAYKQFHMKEIVSYISKVWKDGIKLGITVCIWLLCVVKVIPFYFSLDTTIGFIIAAVILWIAVTVLLMLQWYIPVRSQMPRSFKISANKCLIIFFDNVGFSVFLFFYNLICAILSVFLVSLIPGIAGIVLNLNNALRLRLLKYDWLEERQKTDAEFDVQKLRKEVPWNDLLQQDIEMTGTRSLRSFIFPWKD